MSNIHSLKLCSTDIFQILDALNSRAEAFKQTAHFLSDTCKVNEKIVFDDCSDPFEAREIAKHYQDIVKSIENQI